MAIDWDAEVLGPTMTEFGEGTPADQSAWPIYMPFGGGSFPLADAVFDRQSAEIEPDEAMSDTTVRRPVLGVRLALFAVPPAQNDTVFIPSVAITFIVKDVRVDGHGYAKLILMET